MHHRDPLPSPPSASRPSASSGRPLVAGLALAALTGTPSPQEALSPPAPTALTRRLAADPALQGTDVDVLRIRDVAVLRGRVRTLLQARHARQAVDADPDVRAVLDLLEVVPEVSAPVDAGMLTERVRVSLLAEPGLELEHVTWSVTREGDVWVVTLGGRVESFAEEDSLLRAVERVPGVASVRDDVAVLPPLHRRDEEIREDVLAVLRDAPFAHDDALLVDVRDGLVHVEGSVDDWQEREAVRRRVRVAGVTAVDVESLLVREDPLGRSREARTARRHGPDDGALRALVDEVLDLDPRVPADDVTVGVSHGVVTLDGAVPDRRAARAAERSARSCDGVVGVVNRIEAPPASS